MKAKKDYCSPQLTLTLMSAEDILMGGSAETQVYGTDNVGIWGEGW